MQRVSQLSILTLSIYAVSNFLTADKTANFHYQKIKQGISISLPKTSLAMAAVQDLMYEHSLEEPEGIPNLPSIYLSSESEGVPNPSTFEPGIRTIDMEEGLTLNKEEVIWSKNLNEKELPIKFKQDVRTFTVALNINKNEAYKYLGSDFKLPSAIDSHRKVKVKLDFINDIADEISAHQKTRLEMADNIEDYLDEDWSKYTATNKAQEILQEELAMEKQFSHGKVIQGISSPIYIGVNKGSDAKNKTKRSSKKYVQYGKVAGGDKQKTVEDLLAANYKLIDAEKKQSEPVEGIKSLNLERDTSRDINARVFGYINLVKGLAFTGGEAQIKISHWFAGQLLSKGSFDIEKASYEIEIERVQGDLIAEITDQDDHLLGRGQINLNHIKKQNYNNGIIKNLNIAIHPLGGGLIASAISGYSFDEEIEYIPQAQIAIDQQYWLSSTNYTGVYENEDLLPNSNYLVRMKAKGHRMAMQLAQAGKNTNVVLYSNKMLDSFFQILKDQGLDVDHLKSKGMIWGRVETRIGALEQAKVKISDKNAIGPFYFKNYIVNRGEKHTDASGMFVFLNVKPGLHIVNANIYGNGLNQLAFANENYITTSNLRFGSNISSNLFVFDAQSNEALNVMARVAGSEYEVEKPGQMKISYNDSDQPLFAELFANEEYLPARVSITRGTPNLFVPLVKKSWLEKSMEDARLEDKNLGILIGYIDQDSFDISVNHGDFDLDGNIFFFDQQGRIVEKSLAQPGDIKGYVIANIPEGLNSVQIFPNHGKKFINKLFVSHFHILSIIL